MSKHCPLQFDQSSFPAPGLKERGKMRQPMSWARSVSGILLLIVATTLSSGVSRGVLVAAETSPASGCGSAESNQFDFWVGTWRVTENGALAGHNSIQKIDGACALLESWTGAEGVTGHSLNIHDARRKVWHQTWVDGRGALLLLEGSFRDGSMILEGQRPPSDDGKRSMDRITWTPLPSGQVRQHWQVSSDGGAHWTTSFDGLYTRVPASELTK
jgi:hypothetical protein